jgi:uncharacterized membrane protein YbhN (UPF0104 family)/tRNA A-37 threonylcarbamoyl transferase component Bud32
VRVVAATALVALLALHSQHPSAAERSIIEFFRPRPEGGAAALRLLYDAVSLWAVALVVASVVLVRRRRLARDLLVAGAAAWVGGRLVAFLVQRTDLAHAFAVTFDLHDAPRFPLVRLTLAVAMVTVATPHLTRPMRRVGQVLVLLFMLVALYLSRAAPLDLVAAVILGWGIAAAVHLAFGTPNGRPRPAQVQAALGKLGTTVTGVRAAPRQPVGRALFLGEHESGPVRVTALGRDEADAQFLARAWRFLAFRDTPPILYPTRQRQIEYEASVERRAREAGVRGPEIVVAASSGPLALLVERVPAAVPLFESSPAAVTDLMLGDLWQQVDQMHRAGIVHGRLDGRHVAFDGARAVIDGFEFASVNDDDPDDRDVSIDIGELLASTSAVVGPARAVRAAVEGVGAKAVGAALPVLQPQALSGWTHDALGGRADLDDVLERLRAAGAEAVGMDPPQLRPVYRVHPRSIVLAVAALLGVAALLTQIGNPELLWESIKDANWWFLALACVLGLMTDATFGITFLGNVPVRIPIWASIELQSAMSFSNLAVPVAADAALQVRFLQKNGLDLSSAVAAGGILSAVTEMAVQVGLLFFALWLSPDSINFGHIDAAQIEEIVAGAVVVVAMATAVVLSVRRLRRVVVPPFQRAGRTVWAAVKTPARLGLLFGGNVVAQCLYAASLLACLWAFGETANFWTLLALNIGISLIASIVPIPGGGTAVSVVGMAAALAAVGVPEAAASAAVLAQQVAVTYLPAIPGWFATRDLIKKGML